MKYRSFFAALGAGAAVMLLLPWMAVHFVKGDAGMAVCFLLFFGVNPLFSLAMGVYAGKGRKKTVEPSPCDGGAVFGRRLDYVQSL